MKRRRRGSSFQNSIMSLSANRGALLKRKKLELLLEELTKPEIEVCMLSQHTAMMFSKMQQQNLTIIPQLIKQLQKQNEPIVLEITKNGLVEEKSGTSLSQDARNTLFPQELEETILPQVEDESNVGIDDTSILGFPLGVEGSEETMGLEMGGLSEGGIIGGDKQFEIIYSDSVQPEDGDMRNHIIHSTTESAAGTSGAAGMVNVPNSFPLFQIVHTGEVPEEVQHEIVRLIRQANPELDLNSITFKFKPPETVEIIANVNS